MICKTQRINLLLTAKQLSTWKLYAEESGLSFSEFIRRAVAAFIAASSADDASGQ